MEFCRALGGDATGKFATLFLVESALTGLVGTLLGVLFGLLMARGMAGYIGGLLAGFYGVAQSSGDITVDPRLVAVAIAMGLLTSLVAAVIPAQSAAGNRPCKGFAEGQTSVPE